MATITRGKFAGKSVHLNQWCNDWFSVNVAGQPKIVSPVSIKLTDAEILQVMKSAKTTGTLFQEYLLQADGRFLRKHRNLPS